MFTYKLLTTCLLISTVSGESCIGENNEIGECVKITNCSSAMELLKKNIRPMNHCGFDGLEPIVCCVNKNNEIQELPNEPFPPGCMENHKLRFKRIVGGGGINSLAKEFPHMAALGYDSPDGIIWACGGTLITTNYVLTAAHCLIDKNLGEVKYVRLGDLDLHWEEDDAEPQDFKVIQRIRHPGNKAPAPYNDIAIIKLDRPCNITPYVIPACLNTKAEIPSKRRYSATGWGQLGFGEKLSDHLQNMVIRVYNHTQCQKAYSKISKRRLPNGIDEKTQFCAGAKKIDTCPGDSGGPLQFYPNKRYIVSGITSFGVACVVSSIPGVYTRVSAYIPWIKSIILS